MDKVITSIGLVARLGGEHVRAYVSRLRLDDGAVRVLVLVPVIWLLNLTDLLFTFLASRRPEFIELNPLASHMTSLGQAAFKLTVLCFFTAVFIRLRHHRSVEWGCYFLLAVYGILAAVWFTVFHFVLSSNYLAQVFGS